MAEWLRGRLGYQGAQPHEGLPTASLLLLLALVFSASSAYAGVGRTAGSFQVSPTGASAYQIPIFTPPGPRGVQPSIALVYNSNGGLGYLGRGWSLSGLSSITRCERTVAQDSQAYPVWVSTYDPYCLDGNRLRYQGGGSYGTSGSTWATEIADFSQITANGTAGFGVESWTVKRKDGLTYTYGGSSSSRIMAKPLGYTTANTVRTWLVSEVSDHYGNKIKFTYKTPDSTTSGTTHPTKIEWTQTSLGSGSYVYSMDFAYTAGGNAPASAFTAYVAANDIKNTDLLTSITVSTSGTVVRKYALTYESSPTTDAKRLSEVQECADSSGTDCLGATEITYQDGTVGFNTSSPILSLTASAADGSYDFNGDGIKDIAYLASGTWRVRIGSAGSGYGSEVNTGQSKLRAGKLLGNHKDQLLGLSGSTWHVYEWDGSSFTSTSTGITTGASSTDIVVADTDGDGRADLVYSTGVGTGEGPYNSWDIYPTMGMAVRINTFSGSGPSFGSPVTSTPLLFSLLPYGAVGETIPYGAVLNSWVDWVELSKGGDINGDGREEINGHFQFGWCLDFYEWTWWDGYYWSPGPGPCSVDNYATGIIEPEDYNSFWMDGPRDVYGNPIGLLVTQDMNGDSCDELIITTDWWTNAGVAQSNCSGGPLSNISLGATYWNDWDMQYRGLADWNGDGLKDLIFYNSTSNNMQVRPLLGSGALGSATTLGISGDCYSLQATDGNGDGQEEIICGSSLVYARNSSLRADLAVRFEDGFGVYHSPTYAWNVGSHYTPYTNTAYPYADVVGGRMLVTSVESADGIGGSFTTTYSYHGGRESRQGRAFVGFDKIETVDSRNGVKHMRRFAYEFPYVGMVIEEVTRQSDNTLMSAMTATPAVHVLDPTSYNQRHFPYVLAVTQDTYEVGGTRNGDWITRTEVSNTFDTWGNVTASTKVITDMDSASSLYGQSWTQSTSTSFSPSTGYWCLGLPTSTSTTSSTTVSGESSVTISKSFTPDYVNCRMSADVVEPSNYPRRVDTAYTYDSFGNLYSVGVTGYNGITPMTTRTSTTTWGSANGTSGGTGQFPVSETNALGQTTTRTFHPTFASLVTETDPNSIVVASNEYDTFGRLTRTIRPDGTATRMAYAACATYGCENGDPGSGTTGINKMVVVASERDTGDNPIRDTRTHLDQFDRTIVQKTMTLAGGYSRSGTQYDALGRVYRQTAPCDATSCTAYWVENTYDLLGRTVAQSRPQSQSLSTPVTTTFVYAGRRQEIIDPQNKETIKVLDVNGWMRRSEDHDGYAQLFGYDAAGSLKAVTDTASNTLFTATYDYGIKAFQTATTDMDLGSWSYTYNSLGELVGWTDAKSQSFSQTYDALSRVTSRTDPEGTATWMWGTSSGSKNIGRLAGVSMTGYSESFSYDSIGRPSTQTITTDQSYAIDYAYTSQGLLDTLTYPTSTASTRVKVKYGYANGLLNTVTDWTTGSAGTVYWTANAQNVRGQTTQETLGNGVVTNRTFDAVTGWLNTIQSGPSGALQHLGYQYDLVGNVTQRQENSTLGLTEDFYYDNLYRLDYSTLNSATNLDLTYDSMGNITKRTDVNGNATWTYDGTRKHAVTSTGSGGVTFSYDANGNMTTRAGSTITWSSYNYPTGLTTGTESATFYYGPDRQYYRQVYTGPASPTGYEETHYVGGILEKVYDGSFTDWRHYIHAEGQVVAIVSRPSSGSPAVYYPLEDNQGSGSTLVDASGTGYVRQSYGAFGLPRDGTDWDGAVPGGDQTAINAISRRGYTGHSMLGSMGLIHMNGRVQDATLGRFLSPDPTLPDPGFTQMYNRYAYVNNNPLSYIDPSGFTPDFGELDQLMRRYQYYQSLYGAFCGGFQGVCESMGAELQYYEMALHGMMAEHAAWQFAERTLAEFPVVQISVRTNYANSGGGYNFTDAQVAQIHSDFGALRDQLNSISGRTLLDVADKFAEIALPFTGRWGVELGANIVIGDGGKSFATDTTLGRWWGSRAGVDNPWNYGASAMVHTHPGSSEPSGMIAYTPQRGMIRKEGDLFTAYTRNQDSYIYGTDGTAVHFDQRGFRADLDSAQRSGREIWGTWYVRPIR